MTTHRPLSPHIGIYKREWTMIYSILHRITGIALSGGLMILVAWLFALAEGSESFDWIMAWLTHPIGRIGLLLINIGFFYHLLNGIRHLCWDWGFGFELTTAKRSGHTVMIVAIVLTVVFWLIGYSLV